MKALESWGGWSRHQSQTVSPRAPRHFLMMMLQKSEWDLISLKGIAETGKIFTCGLSCPYVCRPTSKEPASFVHFRLMHAYDFWSVSFRGRTASSLSARGRICLGRQFGLQLEPHLSCTLVQLALLENLQRWNLLEGPWQFQCQHLSPAFASSSLFLLVVALHPLHLPLLLHLFLQGREWHWPVFASLAPKGARCYSENEEMMSKCWASRENGDFWTKMPACLGAYNLGLEICVNRNISPKCDKARKSQHFTKNDNNRFSLIKLLSKKVYLTSAPF